MLGRQFALHAVKEVCRNHFSMREEINFRAVFFSCYNQVIIQVINFFAPGMFLKEYFVNWNMF